MKVQAKKQSRKAGRKAASMELALVAAVRGALAREGCSVREAAERAGVHYVTVYRFLAGRANITLASAERLMAAFRLHAADVFRHST